MNTTAPQAGPDRLHLLAPLLLVLSVSMPPLGAGLAKEVSHGHDILALAFLRNALSAAVILAVVRPSLRNLTRAQWGAAAALGATVAAMNASLCILLSARSREVRSAAFTDHLPGLNALSERTVPFIGIYAEGGRRRTSRQVSS